MDQQLFCWLLFSTENGEIKNLDFDHPSLDVWGIGPGFEETATTFSVCSWLFIYYVVRLVKKYSKLFHDSWFEDDGINWWKRRHLYVTKKNTFFLQRKPNPLWSYCLPRDGKAPLCSSFSEIYLDFNILREIENARDTVWPFVCILKRSS